MRPPPAINSPPGHNPSLALSKCFGFRSWSKAGAVGPLRILRGPGTQRLQLCLQFLNLSASLQIRFHFFLGQALRKRINLLLNQCAHFIRDLVNTTRLWPRYRPVHSLPISESSGGLSQLNSWQRDLESAPALECVLPPWVAIRISRWKSKSSISSRIAISFSGSFSFCALCFSFGHRFETRCSVSFTFFIAVAISYMGCCPQGITRRTPTTVSVPGENKPILQQPSVTFVTTFRLVPVDF